MSTTTLTEERLAELLVEAKKAHARFEAETGEYDEDWPRWYASYILERLNELEQPPPEVDMAGD